MSKFGGLANVTGADYTQTEQAIIMNERKRI